MPEINVIDWHIHPYRADRWYAIWMPAFERARSYGAIEATMTRSEDDRLHFRQTTVWENRDDFQRYWTSDDAAAARQAANTYYNKPLLPTWHAPAERG
jgi:heme-degrading monooxygenase HmoA